MHFVDEKFAIFCATLFLLFFLLGRVGQKGLLLAAGAIFSGFYNPWFAATLGLCWMVNFAVCIAMERQPERVRFWMYAGVAYNLAVLGFFKYFDFFTGSAFEAAAAFGVDIDYHALRLVTPIGISFYTFQVISYLVDLRNRRVGRMGFIDMGVYLSFWPKLVAGPIIRARHFAPQLARRRTFEWRNLFLGSEYFIYGLFLKAVLSDFLEPMISRVYDNPDHAGGASSVVAALFYTFQIYGDFAGYSLMVIGLARVLGYKVWPNFRRPNFATSFSDFWARWHISLSSWLGEYVFRNLSSREQIAGAGPGRKEYLISRNQMLTLLTSGLWHGAAWTFVGWGGLHGLMLVLQRQVGRPLRRRLELWRVPELAMIASQMAVVFGVVLCSRIVFRSASLGDAGQVFHNIAFGSYDPGQLGPKIPYLVAFAIIALVLGGEALVEYGVWRRRLRRRKTVRVILATAVLLLTLFVGDFGGGRFIYVQF